MGLALDYCVKYSALDARQLGLTTYVILDGCRGIELEPGDIDRALDEMKRADTIYLEEQRSCSVVTHLSGYGFRLFVVFISLLVSSVGAVERANHLQPGSTFATSSATCYYGSVLQLPLLVLLRRWCR